MDHMAVDRGAEQTASEGRRDTREDIAGVNKEEVDGR